VGASSGKSCSDSPVKAVSSNAGNEIGVLPDLMSLYKEFQNGCND
jgi:hypothetical protein